MVSKLRIMWKQTVVGLRARIARFQSVCLWAPRRVPLGARRVGRGCVVWVTVGANYAAAVESILQRLFLMNGETKLKPLVVQEIATGAFQYNP